MDTVVPKKAFAWDLLEWYSRNRLEYPWRYKNDPFLVLVSEFLLQQTKSGDAVGPYLKLVQRYRNIPDMANAELPFLNGIFAGLGLFYRAERLLSAARYLLSAFGGEIPDSLEDLLSVPGIGAYCGSAVLCFGFGRRVAVLDTNIIRIYSRIFGLKAKTSRPRQDRELWRFANEMLPEKGYVDFNYALLDFGKLVCTSRNPKCAYCPFEKTCLYRRAAVSDSS